ncbi:unnamed protein product [Chironomus riparius]|uniref:Uncharacterized protein n=1 Tax=Chironomus riparius TaxID=315576 RepID=A0A9N9WX87_9DIPT|nr:unnamed protein product [Chironomus riparius]
MKSIAQITAFVLITSQITSITSEKSINGYNKERKWYELDIDLTTFTIKSDEVISMKNTEVLAKESKFVKGFYFELNKNIEYLPTKIHEKFPNLVAYDGSNLALKEIKYQNFEKLEELQYLTLKDLTKLKNLTLRSNQLNYIDEELFKNLASLMHLDLDKNQINFLPKGIFKNMPELQEISLSDNKLQELDGDSFGKNKKLETIWLDGNDLKILSATMFDDLDKLKVVYLKGNDCVDSNFCANSDCSLKFSDMKTRIKDFCKLTEMKEVQ